MRPNKKKKKNKKKKEPPIPAAETVGEAIIDMVLSRTETSKEPSCIPLNWMKIQKKIEKKSQKHWGAMADEDKDDDKPIVALDERDIAILKTYVCCFCCCSFFFAFFSVLTPA